MPAYYFDLISILAGDENHIHFRCIDQQMYKDTKLPQHTATLPAFEVKKRSMMVSLKKNIEVFLSG